MYKQQKFNPVKPRKQAKRNLEIFSKDNCRIHIFIIFAA